MSYNSNHCIMLYIHQSTVKLRYEALRYDTISDMSRWARGPRGIFQGVQYVKY